jgi:hypothetical protein
VCGRGIHFPLPLMLLLTNTKSMCVLLQVSLLRLPLAYPNLRNYIWKRKEK